MNKIKACSKLRKIYLKYKLKLIKYTLMLLSYNPKKEKLTKKMNKKLKKCGYKLSKIYIYIEPNKSNELYKLCITLSSLIFIDDEILGLFGEKLLKDDICAPLYIFVDDDYFELVRTKFNEISDYARVTRDLKLIEKDNIQVLKDKYIEFLKEVI